MSALDLTVKAPPVFLSANKLTRYADQNSDLVLSSGLTLRHRLYDMDPAGAWAGENANDAVDETAEFGLWKPGAQMSQDVDFLAVLGHNLKAFDWDLSDDDGVTYPGANQQASTLQTADYKINSLAAVIPADKVKLTMHTTQTASQYKQVGALVVAEALLQMSTGMSLFKKQPPRVKARTATMHDGSIRSSYIYRSDASLAFRNFAVGFKGLPEAEADALEAILLGADPFIFYPEPGNRPANMYQGRVVPGTYTRDYVALSRSGGELVTFDFEETGGA